MSRGQSTHTTKINMSPDRPSGGSPRVAIHTLTHNLFSQS